MILKIGQQAAVRSLSQWGQSCGQHVLGDTGNGASWRGDVVQLMGLSDPLTAQ